jgi:hypothetical protein
MGRRGARAIGCSWVALAVLTPLAACVTGSGVRVRAQPVPGVDLTRYATYAWASPSVAEVTAARVRGTSGDIFQSLPSGPASDREALDTRIRSDVDAQLARCGYTRTRGGRPDLLIDYRVTTQEKALNDQLGEYASYRSEGGDQSLGDAFVRRVRGGNARRPHRRRGHAAAGLERRRDGRRQPGATRQAHPRGHAPDVRRVSRARIARRGPLIQARPPASGRSSSRRGDCGLPPRAPRDGFVASIETFTGFVPTLLIVGSRP